MSKEKLKLLIIGSTFSINGGVQNYLYNLVTNLDLNLIDITYLSTKALDNDETYINEYTKLGIKCVFIENFSKRNYLAFYKFIRKNKKFDIIHINLTSGHFVVYGVVSKLLTKAKVIFHSHTYKPYLNLSLREKLIQLFYRSFGDYFLSCSKSAGEYMFGNKIYENNKFMIAKNGISKERFYVDTNSRFNLRTDFNLNDEIVYGYVGRIDIEKNIGLLIQVFYEIHKIQKNAVLIIVGDGPKMPEVEILVESLNLSKHVKFCGVKSNIPDFMNAFDLLLLTSLFESLGIVLIEAQACGLNCLVSSSIFPDSDITPLWHQMEAESSPKEWALRAVKLANHSHCDYWPLIEKQGYSINNAVEIVQNYYTRIIDERNK